ncbi:MAG: triose-phosphate isomerase [Bacteroidales bacterium]|nr:triose-phosphate isomerase [Bacteroidales bacterium]
MRTKIVAGNWKMNKTFDEADTLIYEILDQLEEKGKPENVDVIICPPYIFLELAGDITEDSPVFVGAQNVSQFESGAYTGEISAPMLRSMHIDFAIIGHSERRKYFRETDEELYSKVEAALKHDIAPIFCCGELLEERETGQHFDIVRQQLEETIFKLDAEDFARVIIAYEPVWAIGTGVNATSQQAQEMHFFIRDLIWKKFGAEVAADKTILYGGSCNAKNAKELFSMPDVDGGLIGGASLKADEFVQIIMAAAE